MHTTKPVFTESPASGSPGELVSEKSAIRTVAFWLSLLLIFMIPWEDMIALGRLGTTGARLVGLPVAAFWIFTAVVTNRFRKPRPFHVAIYLFVLWNAMSVFWSLDVEATVARVLTYFQLAGLVFILWDLYRSSAALKAGLQAYVLGAYVAIGSQLANYFAGSQGSYLRYSATGFNENDLGLILALGIPIAWHLAVSESSSTMTRALRLANFAYIPSAILAILLTATRGALLASLPAFMFVLGSFPRLKLIPRVLILAALASALFALQPLIPESSIQRLASTGPSIVELDLGGRVEVWRQGIAVYSDHPVLGVGSSAFRAVVEAGTVAHNSFLSVLTELGPVGLGLFGIILAMTVHHAMRQPKWESRFWLSVLMVWAIGVSSVTWEHKKQTWLILNFVVVSASLSARREEFSSSSGFFATSRGLARTPVFLGDEKITQSLREV